MIAFLLAYLISPLVFIPLYICECSKNKKLKKTIDEILSYNASQQTSNPSEQQNPVQNQILTPPPPEPVPFNQTVTAEIQENVIPAPVPVQMYQAPPVQSAVIQEKKTVSTPGILMMVGAVFIVLSGLIFATAAWEILPALARIIVMFSFSAFFIGLSAFAEKKLKIHKTALSFFFIGSVFIPISILAIGFFRLMGDWFSLYGNGRYLLLLTGFAALFIAMLIGISWYSQKLFSVVAWGSLSAMIICLAKSFYLSADVFSLVMAIYCAFPIIFGKKIAAVNASEKVMIFTSFAETFAIINTSAVAFFCIIFSGMGITSGAASIIFACLFLSGMFNEKTKALGGGIPFMLFSMLGAIRVFSPDGFNGILAVVAAVSAVFAVMGMMNIISDKLRKVLNLASSAIVFINVITTMIYSAFNDWTIPLVIAAGVMLFNIVLLAFREKERILYCGSVFAFIVFIRGFISIFEFGDLYTPLLMSAALVILFAALYIIKNNPFRSIENDVVIFGFLLMCAVFITKNSTNAYVLCFLGWAAVVSVSCIMSYLSKNDIFKNIMTYILPFLGLTLLVSPIKYLVTFKAYETTSLIFAGYMLIVVVLCAIHYLRYNDTKAHRFLSFLSFSFLGGMIFPVIYFNNSYAFTFPIFASALFIFIFALHQREGKGGNLFFYVGASLFSVFSFITVLNLTENMRYNVTYAVVSAAVMPFILSIIGIVLKRDEENPLYAPIKNFSCWALIFFSLLFAVCSLDSVGDRAYWVVSYYLIISALFALTTKTSQNVFVAIPLLLFWSVLYYSLGDIENIWISAGIISAVLVATSLFGRYLKQNVFEKSEDIIYIDHFGIINIIGAFYAGVAAESAALFWLLALAYVINLYNRLGKNKNINPSLITISCLCGCFMLWTQKVLEIPEIIRDEYYVLPVVVICFFLKKIWQDRYVTIEWVRFSTAIISILYLAAKAIDSGLSADAVILSMGILAIIVSSFIVKRKKWFMLGIISLVGLVFYLTFRLWSSAAWWLYLLLAGGILIALAAFNELKKQRGSSGKNIFDGWEW